MSREFDHKVLYVLGTFQGLGQILELTSRNPGNSFSPYAMLYRGRDYKNQTFREKGVGKHHNILGAAPGYRSLRFLAKKGIDPTKNLFDFMISEFSKIPIFELFRQSQQKSKLPQGSTGARPSGG